MTRLKEQVSGSFSLKFQGWDPSIRPSWMYQRMEWDGSRERERERESSLEEGYLGIRRENERVGAVESEEREREREHHHECLVWRQRIFPSRRSRFADLRPHEDRSGTRRSLSELKGHLQKKIYFIQFTSELMVMSSFLMNSSPAAYAAADPMFPPTEEYSQNNYTQDYYAAATQAQGQSQLHHPSSVYDYHHPHLVYPSPTSLSDSGSLSGSVTVPSGVSSAYASHHSAVNHPATHQQLSSHGHLSHSTSHQYYNSCGGVTHPTSHVSSGPHPGLQPHSSGARLPSPALPHRSPSPRQTGIGTANHSGMVEHPSPPDCTSSAHQDMVSSLSDCVVMRSGSVQGSGQYPYLEPSLLTRRNGSLAGYADPTSPFTITDLSCSQLNGSPYHLSHHHLASHLHNSHHRPGVPGNSVGATAPVPTYKWMQVKRNAPKQGMSLSILKGGSWDVLVMIVVGP